MSRLLIFGLGYTAARLAARLRGEGWQVVGTTRDGRGETIAFDDEPRVRAEIAAATHLLSSVPPADGGDPVLARYGATLQVHRGWAIGRASCRERVGPYGSVLVVDVLVNIKHYCKIKLQHPYT